MGLESFSSVTEEQESLLQKKYCFGSLALFRLRSEAPQIAFRAKASQQRDSTVSASAALEVKEGKVTCSPKFYTNNTRSLSVEYEAAENLKFKGKCTLVPTEPVNTVFSAEFANDQVRALFALSNPSTAQFTSTFGCKTSGVSVDTKFDLAKNRFTTYNFLAYWAAKNNVLALKHESTHEDEYAWGDFVLSYFCETSEKTKVGAKATLNWHWKDTTIDFGGSYKYSPDVELRGKLNNHGLIAAGITKAFSDAVKVTLAVQVDSQKAAHAGTSDYLLGARVDLNL